MGRNRGRAGRRNRDCANLFGGGEIGIKIDVRCVIITIHCGPLGAIIDVSGVGLVFGGADVASTNGGIAFVELSSTYCGRNGVEIGLTFGGDGVVGGFGRSGLVYIGKFGPGGSAIADFD